jgi:putative PEP-CTERM system histidine kinase
MPMLTQILLWLNIPICLIGLVILFSKRIYPIASLFISFGLFFFGIGCFINIQILQSPDDLLNWYRYSLLLQLGSTFGFYYYTKTIYRDNSEVYKGPGFWLSSVLALSVIVFSSIIPIEQLIFSPDFADEHIIYLTKYGFGIYLIQMLYLVFGLVQLERTLTGLHPLQRWKVKLEVIGSGLLLTGMALYFSHSLLYRSINFDYLGWRGLVSIAAVACLSYSRLFRSSGSRLALSRGIAHRSLVLLIVGGYLIILGIVGEGLRYLNLTNLKPAIYGLLLLGALGLAVLFLSEKLRRRVKVTLHKNFYQSKYDYRNQWEMFTQRVAANKTLEDMQPAILDLFCENLACKGASLYLHDHETGDYLFSSSFNFRRDWRPFPTSDPLITMLEDRDWIVNLKEDNPELETSIISTFADVGAFLILPMLFDDDLVGFIILGEQINPNEELTYEDFDLLRMLARQSVASIQGVRLSEQLSMSRELASIGKLSTFVLHDLKNQVSGLSLMLDNAKDYISDPDFQQDMLETVEATVKNMKGLIARLKNVKEKPQLAFSTVDLKKIINDAVDTAGGGMDISGEAVIVSADDEEIYKVILNLLVNAKEAAGASKPVQIECGVLDQVAFVKVTDDGCGMTSEFMEKKLFKPFETTKQHGFGIGLYQSQQIMEAHGGVIDVESELGQGTTFILTLPLDA